MAENEMTEIEIEFPQEIVDQIETIVKVNGGTFSEFVNQALTDALKYLEDEGGGPAGGVPFFP